MAYTQTDRPVKVTSPLGADKLIVQSVSGEERISGLYRYDVTFFSEDHDIAFADIVGKPVKIAFEQADESEHHLTGIVGRFTHVGAGARGSIYQAELHPWLWLTTMNSGCRIFQNKTTPEIVKALFDELGFTDYKDSLTGSYTAREFCVQYNESTFAFVSRLMEEEGIFYFFEHDASGHKMVLADDNSAFAAAPGAATLPIRTHEWTEGPCLFDCVASQSVTVGQVKFDDYNFETPATDLLVTASATDTARAIYEYPGNLLQKSPLEARAKLVLEACEAPGKTLRGSGHAPTLRAGYKFAPEDHPRAEVNADWVIRTYSFQFDQSGEYSSSFEAFPHATPFRPERATPRPRVHGAQTATVVGKAGEEVWTDKYGRVKVRFHWDQESKSDENSSCWIRVAQGWAGKSWGIIFIPRIDQEVVVSFLDGDPDRPLITGCVYNATQTVPYTLPSDQTKSTIKSNTSKGGGGFNEFRFEDKKDSEEIFLHAQKDFNITVLNNQTSTVKKNRKTTVEEEHDTLIVEKGDRTIQVNTGKETHEVKGTRAVTVTGDETHTNKANFDQKVTGNFTLKVDGNITIEASGSVKIKSGTTFDTEAGSNMTNKATANLTNEAGANLKNDAKANLDNIAAANLTNKAGANLVNDGGVNVTNKAGVALTNQASASQTVDGGGMLALKGGMIKLN